MPARFFAPDARAPGDRLSLPADEAAHLTRVLRLRAGDRIRIFNGRGGEFEARIEAIARTAVCVAIERAADGATEPRIAVTLAQAVLKGDRMDGVVRDAVMLGAAAIQPVLSARSETTLPMLERGGRRSRWERLAIASSKQCGRARLPAIHPPCTFEALVAARDASGAAATVMFVEPGASREAVPLSALVGERPQEVMVVLGPEGGWTAQEIAAGARAWRLVTMRLPTLRADAMPSVALAALFATWQEI
jgi:16S rRNA (uracil1498-N3)-methyltransferase